MRFLCIVSTAGLFLLRLHLTALLFQRINLLSLLIASLSLWAIISTALAWLRGVGDLTPRGVAVGVLYLVPLMFHPGPSSSPFWLGLFACGLALKCWVKWDLGTRCTVTGSVFVSVADTGAYRFLRHPMMTAEMILGLSVVGNTPTIWNLAIFGLVVLSKVLVVTLEENFLQSFKSYRDYMQRVPWKLLPRVW